MLIFHLFFAVVVLLLTCAALLFALVMPRTTVAISAALAVARLDALGVWVSTSWAAPSTSWAVFDQLSAQQIHQRAAAILPLLPWAVAPLVDLRRRRLSTPELVARVAASERSRAADDRVGSPRARSRGASMIHGGC